MSKSHKLAWAAGFFDGEGSVSIVSSASNRSKSGSETKYHRLHLSISQKNQTPLLEIQRLFGGKIYIKTDKGKAVGYVWNLGNEGATEMLKQIMPYLVQKQQVAAIGLDFHNTKTKSTNRVPDEVIALRENYRREIIRINSLD